MAEHVGQQFGQYRLTKIMGHGGFADVYLGEHIHLGTQAAIKVLNTQLYQGEVSEFREEARIIAHLEHPHIVRVLDFGVQDQIPFLVMANAPNGTLRQRHPRGSRLSPRQIVDYVKQIASALQYAHDHKVVHRDIKPENMLIGRDGEILISDFGLAIISRSSSQETLRDVSGTITYMAPEQARGKPRPASDQYALAIVVYEWLCGKRPFDGSYQEIAVQQVLASPPLLHEIVPGISNALEDVVLKALAKDPHGRYDTIIEFAQALEQACQHDGNSHSQLSSNFAPPTPPATSNNTLVLQGAERSTFSESIYAIAWSPSGKHIAYGGRDRTVQVQGITTGASSLVYRGHTGSITTLTWSLDQQLIASASLDKTIQVWQACDGLRISSYGGHTEMIYGLAWSPNSKLLASSGGGGADTSVQLWEAATGNNVFTYRGHTYWVRSIAWSPDGKHLVTGSYQEAQVWEATGGRKLQTYRGHSSWIRATAWSPDGSKIATAGEDRTVQVWELSKGKQLTAPYRHPDWISIVAWSPDGKKIASLSKDGSAHVWDSATGTTRFSAHSYPASAHALLWLQDGKHLICASGEGQIQVWQVP
jgi:eukaryotic-like serine/threonine-protein kinase